MNAHPPLSADLAFQLTVRLGAAMLVVVCLETIFSIGDLSDAGLMSWRIARSRLRWMTRHHVSRVLDSLLKYPNVIFLILCRLVIGLTLAFGVLDLVEYPWIAAIVLATGLLLFARGNYGYDGADQMNWILFGSLSLVSIESSGTTRLAFLWFIAIQACLSYLVAGVAKATAKGWRDGSFLIGIVGTRMYGHPGLGAILRTHPRLSAALSVGIISWECCFVFVLLAPPLLALLWLTLGFVFHMANAYIMGLNTFLWSFLSTYPAILYCSGSI